MDKAAMRTAYKAKRAQLSHDQLEDLSLAIANRALTLPIWDKAFYHIFLPIERLREINTEYLLHILQGKDKNVVLSKSDFDLKVMHHFLLQDNTQLKKSTYGIVEPVGGIPVLPSQIEVVFVPLLAYDLKGNRLGYGAGFYDRFLSLCQPDILKVGLSFFEAQTTLEATPMDIPLDYCITPDKVYSF